MKKRGATWKRRAKIAAGVVAGVWALQWIASSATRAAAGVVVRAGRDAVADAYERLTDDARDVFDTWLEFYKAPFEVASAALYALGEMADQPVEALQTAWTWWREKFDPEDVTPEDPPDGGFGGGETSGGGASSSW